LPLSNKMTQISKALVWSVVKNNHALMMKRPNCRAFSREAFILRGSIHSSTLNVFIKPTGIDVVSNKDGKSVTICKRVKHGLYKPNENYKLRTMKCSDKKAFLEIRGNTKSEKIRPDFEMTASSRASTILGEQKCAAVVNTLRPHLTRLAQWRRRDARKKAVIAKMPADKLKAKKVKKFAGRKQILLNKCA